MPKEEELEIEIIDRTKIMTYPTPEKAVEVYSITFTGPDIPPLTVHIPTKEWDEAREIEDIKKAIREYRERKPEILKVKL